MWFAPHFHLFAFTKTFTHHLLVIPWSRCFSTARGLFDLFDQRLWKYFFFIESRPLGGQQKPRPPTTNVTEPVQILAESRETFPWCLIHGAPSAMRVGIDLHVARVTRDVSHPSCSRSKVKFKVKLCPGLFERRGQVDLAISDAGD